MQSTEIVERIRARANKVFREATNPRKLHWSMQKNMTALARELGFKGYAEKNTGDGQLDVIWTDQDGNDLVAIEIDSSPRARSVRKLNERSAPIGIWIYYGTIPINYDTSQFIVIQAPPERRFKKKAPPKPKRGYYITVSPYNSSRNSKP